jgi:hypothetical protein
MVLPQPPLLGLQYLHAQGDDTADSAGRNLRHPLGHPDNSQDAQYEDRQEDLRSYFAYHFIPLDRGYGRSVDLWLRLP